MPPFLKRYGKTIIITTLILLILTVAFFLTGKQNNQSERNDEDNLPVSRESAEFSKEDSTVINQSSCQSVASQKTNDSSAIQQSSLVSSDQLPVPIVSKESEESAEETSVSQSESADSLHSEEETSSAEYVSDTFTAPSSTSSEVPDASEKSKAEKKLSEASEKGDASEKLTESDDEVKNSIPDSNKYCVIGIDCRTLVGKENLLPKNKRELVPANGILLYPAEVSYEEGESVFDVTKRICTENRIPFEFTLTPLYQTAYIEGIFNLYEFDCGSGSGWVYSVNDEMPSIGCSGYMVKEGDIILWHYTCELGHDINPEDYSSMR
jgi:hypothetical protein